MLCGCWKIYRTSITMGLINQQTYPLVKYSYGKSPSLSSVNQLCSWAMASIANCLSLPEGDWGSTVYLPCWLGWTNTATKNLGSMTYLLGLKHGWWRLVKHLHIFSCSICSDLIILYNLIYTSLVADLSHKVSPFVTIPHRQSKPHPISTSSSNCDFSSRNFFCSAWALRHWAGLEGSAGKEQRQIDQLDPIFIHAWCYGETHDF